MLKLEVDLGSEKRQIIAGIGKAYNPEDLIGKEIIIDEVFKEGAFLDVHGVTKGKGFQGPVKRHGIMLRHHKSEKSRRGNKLYINRCKFGV